jgi:inhibitor of growth protein 3
MPIARNNTYTPTNGSVAGVAATDGAATEVGEGEGDGEGDGDDNKRYCFCNGVSYGEMIACDDDHCEKEWVRLDISNLKTVF